MRKNRAKAKFLAELPDTSIDEINNDLACRCKFNFSYFEAQAPHGQDFSDWTHEQLVKLFEKLKNYSRCSLKKCEDLGLVIYPSFPANSEFTRPVHVPREARWGRFRLGNMVRFVGFVLPDDRHGDKQNKSENTFDCNTFYVVFLDKDHLFYKTEPK